MPVDTDSWRPHPLLHVTSVPRIRGRVAILFYFGPSDRVLPLWRRRVAVADLPLRLGWCFRRSFTPAHRRNADVPRYCVVCGAQPGMTTDFLLCTFQLGPFQESQIEKTWALFRKQDTGMTEVSLKYCRSLALAWSEDFNFSFPWHQGAGLLELSTYRKRRRSRRQPMGCCMPLSS